jgi:hypothetical protein
VREDTAQAHTGMVAFPEHRKLTMVMRSLVRSMLAGIALAALAAAAEAQPILTVTLPVDNALARPLIRVTASFNCGAPCSNPNLAVDVENSLTLYTAPVTSIDRLFSLDAWEGRQVNIVVTVRGNGYTTFIRRRVFVDSDVHLQPVLSVGGSIRDFDEARVLYVDSSYRMNIYDRNTTQVTTIENPDSFLPDAPEINYLLPAYLTSHGAIFVAQNVNHTVEVLREWRDGTLLTFGKSDQFTLIKNGHFVIWSGYTNVEGTGDRKLYVRDLDVGTTTEVPYTGIVFGLQTTHVAEDGTVAFESSGNVFLYRSSVQQLTFTGTSIRPRTDGTNTLYYKSTAPAGIYVNDGVTDQLIATRASLPTFPPDNEYQVRNGWKVVALDEGQVRNPYLFSPTGQTERLAAFGTSTFIETLAANG